MSEEDEDNNNNNISTRAKRNDESIFKFKVEKILWLVITQFFFNCLSFTIGKKISFVRIIIRLLQSI